MAIIGKIRDKSWLLLLIVGGAMVAFIIGVYADIRGQVEYEFGYGTVHGELVDINAFNAEVNLAQQNADMRAAQQGQQSTPVDKSLVWTSFVEKIVLDKEYEALGISVSEAEFDAYLYGKEGFEVPTDIQDQFKDSITGMFNEQLLQSTIEQLETSEDPEDQKRWEQSKEYYLERRKQEKYFSILNQGVYVTNLEAKQEYVGSQEIKSIAYIIQRYGDINDEDIDTSDEKLKAYFEEHKDEKKYANKTSSREVKFFDIVINPSGADSAAFDATIEDLRTEFAATTNDSSFVLANSDLQFYTSNAYSTAVPDRHPKAQQHLTYPAYMQPQIDTAQIGDIIGPYDFQEKRAIAKVIGFTRDTINARHILLPIAAGNEAEVEARADSILNVINSGNFEEYVQKYSTDQGSKVKGGDLGDFFFSDMVQPFAMFCVDKPIGEIGKVTSQFGIHIIEVLDRKGPNHPRLAVIQKEFGASDNTILEKDMEVDKLIYNLNDELALIEPGAKRVERFDTLVNQADKGYIVRPMTIEENDPKVYSFNSKVSEDKILKLAFSEGAQVGDLIDAPIKEGNRYIIAVLSGIKEEGAPKFEDVEPAIMRDYIQDEKVKRLSAKMVGAQSMATLEKKLGTTAVKCDVTFSKAQLAQAGYEPEVVGAIFSGLEDGSRTKPLEGKQGVYVVQIEKTTKVQAAADYEAEKTKLLTDKTRNMQNQATKALVEQAEVVNNRRFFDANIRK